MTIPGKIANFCESNLDFDTAKLSDEYYYQSLPLCVIDAVYSIGAVYSSTRNVVIRFCNKFELKRIREPKYSLPTSSEQLSIADFLEKFKYFKYEKLAEEIFENRQRTSTRNGILKAEAVIKFASILKTFDANYLNDREKFIGNKSFKKEIMKIPGQRSGISVRYFFMLAGSDDYIKPDRMITRFIKEQTGKKFSIEESHALIIETQKILSKKYKKLTPRLLDHLIWNYQSGRQ